MAIFHLSLKSIGLTNGGVVRKAAYNSGGHFEPSNALKRESKNSNIQIRNCNFANKRSDVMANEILSKFSQHRNDREALWQSVEERETRKTYNRQTRNKNGVFEKKIGAEYAKSIIVNIPSNLNDKEKIKLVKKFCVAIKNQYDVPVDYCIHYPSGINRTIESHKNYHAHILIGCRGIDSRGNWNKTKAKFTKGNRRDILKKWREDWAGFINQSFKSNEIDESVDHRSFKDMGISFLKATRHEGTGRNRKTEAVIQNQKEMIFRKEFFNFISENPEANKEETAKKIRSEINQISENLIKKDLRQNRTKITKEALYLPNKNTHIITNINNITEKVYLDIFKMKAPAENKFDLNIFSEQRADEKLLPQKESSLERDLKWLTENEKFFQCSEELIKNGEIETLNDNLENLYNKYNKTENTCLHDNYMISVNNGNPDRFLEKLLELSFKGMDKQNEMDLFIADKNPNLIKNLKYETLYNKILKIMVNEPHKAIKMTSDAYREYNQDGILSLQEDYLKSSKTGKINPHVEKLYNFQIQAEAKMNAKNKEKHSYNEMEI